MNKLYVTFLALLITSCAFKETPPVKSVEALPVDPNAFATATFNWSTDQETFEATRNYRSQNGDEAESSVPLVIGENAPKQMDVSITFVDSKPWAISQTTFKLIDGGATYTLKTTPTTSGDDGNPLPGGWAFRLDLSDHEAALNKPQLLAIDIYGIKGFETHKRMTVNLLISPKNVTSSALPEDVLRAYPGYYRVIEQVQRRRSLVAALKFTNQEDWPIKVTLPTRIESSFVEKLEHTDVQDQLCSHTLTKTQRDVIRGEDVIFLPIDSAVSDETGVLAQFTQAINTGSVNLKIQPKSEATLGVFTTGERAYNWVRGRFTPIDYQSRTAPNGCNPCCVDRRPDGTIGLWNKMADQYWQPRGWPGASRICAAIVQQCPRPTADPGLAVQCAVWELTNGTPSNHQGRYCQAYQGFTEMWNLNQGVTNVPVGDRTVELAVQTTVEAPTAIVTYDLNTDEPPIQRQLPGLIPNRITVFKR